MSEQPAGRRRRRPDRWALAVGVASAVVPFASTAAMIGLRSDAPTATLALGLAAVVAVLAAAGTHATAVIAALSAGLGFDTFLTKPYGSLAIDRSGDVETVGLLVAVGLIVGQLAVRNRRHRHLATSLSDDLGRVHGVAEMVSEGAPAHQVVLAVANEIRDLLHLRECHFEPTFADPPGPFVERHGAITWGALSWDFREIGLPARELSLIVAHQGLPLGRFVLATDPGTRATGEQLAAAITLADQAGAALAAQTSSN